jgi:hypothetical protein
MNNQRIQNDDNQKTDKRGTTLQKRIIVRATILLGLMILITLASTRLRADTGNCTGVAVSVPFTDVAGSPFFCQIATAYFSGLTSGTGATTYSPNDFVTREQMAAFTTRTLDQALLRGSRRAALKRFSTPKTNNGLDFVIVGNGTEQTPIFGIESDGEDIWSSDLWSGSVKRLHASDGKLLGVWTGVPTAWGLCVADGKIYTASATTPGQLSVINPKLAPGPVTVGANNLGGKTQYLAYDGEYMWTADYSGSVSQVNIHASMPWPVSIFSAGFSHPNGILYDGNNIWITDAGDDTLKKLDPIDGSVIQTVPVGDNPHSPVFDGANIWVPNFSSNSITVVRASSGVVLATLTGNGLDKPAMAAFDGERILVTNTGNPALSLWKAASLAPLHTFHTNPEPFAVCSDGLNFWIAFDRGRLARF